MPLPTPVCLEAALGCLERGWSAIPLCPPDHEGVPGDHEMRCRSPGKAPLWAWKEYQDRRARPAELRLFWSRVRNLNVGVCMGPVSGLVGLDIDGSTGEVLLQELSGGDVPPTLAFTTPSGGRRLLYRWPDVALPIKTFPTAGKEALRLLSHGSQTVMPPSRHQLGGTYAWIPGCHPEEIEAAPCPAWLLALDRTDKETRRPGDKETARRADQPNASPAAGPASLSPGLPVSLSPCLPASVSPDQMSRARAYLARCPPAVAGQGGHNQTFKVACKLFQIFALDRDAAFSLLWNDYNPRCVPPWTEKELRHKVEDAFKINGAVGAFAGAIPPRDAAPTPPTAPGLAAGSAPVPPRMFWRRFSDIAPEALSWLWPGWLPLGKLALLDGDPGLGKSTLLLDLAARVSRDGRMPDGSSGIAGTVVLLSAEDGAADTIRPRLDVAAAALDRIIALMYIVDLGKNHCPEIPRDLPLLEAMLLEVDARLLIIDPLAAFLCGSDINKDQEVRRVLFELSQIAERCRCAVICMRHLNKSGGGKALYRGNMSIGVIAHARTGLLVGEDPDNPRARVLSVTKVNLGPKPGSLRFCLDPQGDVCRIGWMGASPHSADDLVQAPTGSAERERQDEFRGTVQGCIALLADLLAPGPGRVRQIKQELADAGFTGMTVQRAARKLGVVFTHTLEQGRRTYWWELPAAGS
jgi:hypothetical protein